MSTTRGVLYIHSAPSALCPHIEWAVGGVFGMPVRVSWTAQPIERSANRCEYVWAGPVGTAWLNALQMTIIPLVFSLVVTGMASSSASSLSSPHASAQCTPWPA